MSKAFWKDKFLRPTWDKFRAIFLGLLIILTWNAAYSLEVISTSSNSGTTSAQHAVLVLPSTVTGGTQLRFFSAICTGASSTGPGYCMVFDSATVPADGAVTPKMCAAISAAVPATSVTAPPSQGIAVGAGQNPVTFFNGIVVVYSTGANCSTKTTSDGTSVFVQANYGQGNLGQ